MKKKIFILCLEDSAYQHILSPLIEIDWYTFRYTMKVEFKKKHFNNNALYY